MKKTKRTLITAAILTTAATMCPDTVSAISEYNSTDAFAAVYGPPSVFYKKGDVSQDDTVNIADLCLMLNAASGEGDFVARDISDLNYDGTIDKLDINSLKNYLFGKTSEVIALFEEEPTPQPEYGCFETSENDEVK